MLTIMKKTYLQPSTAYELIEAEEMMAASALNVPDIGGVVGVDGETVIDGNIAAEVRAAFGLFD